MTTPPQLINAPQPQPIDFSQLAPVVMEYQKGEIEKMKVHADAQVAITQINMTRQIEVDKSVASRDRRRDLYDGITTAALFIGCAGLTGYGMWNRDAGFITAGLTSFASFLAGKKAGKPGAPTP